MSFPMHDIQRRISVSLALGRYVRALDRMHAAAQEIDSAGDELCTELGSNCRFVTEINFQHYLVISDQEANFVIEKIDCL